MSKASWFAVLLVGCGNYDPAAMPGGSGGQGGTGSGGSSAQAGSGGGSGSSGSSSAGAGGAVTSGGSGGQAGSGGSGGSAGDGGTGGGPILEFDCPDPVPEATPCGGDVEGTWGAASCPLTVTGQMDMMGFGLGCQSAEITSGTMQMKGTWTADSSGMFTDGTVTTGETEVEMPPGCLNVSGTTTTCDRVADPVRSALGYETFTCVDNDDTGGCTCSGTFNQFGGLALITAVPPTTGSYTSMDSTLTLGQDMDAVDYSYCVMDTTMVLTLETVGKTGSVMGPIVLLKQ